jgi:hypothetical protein
LDAEEVNKGTVDLNRLVYYLLLKICSAPKFRAGFKIGLAFLKIRPNPNKDAMKGHLIKP